MRMARSSFEWEGGRQHVAGAAHRADEARLARVVAELLPEPADEDVDRAVVDVPFAAFQLGAELVAVDRAAGVGGQQLEGGIFRGRERDALLGHGHVARDRVDLEVAELQGLGMFRGAALLLRAAAPQRSFTAAARQTAMDPDDGMAL